MKAPDYCPKCRRRTATVDDACPCDGTSPCEVCDRLCWRKFAGNTCGLRACTCSGTPGDEDFCAARDCSEHGVLARGEPTKDEIERVVAVLSRAFERATYQSCWNATPTTDWGAVARTAIAHGMRVP
jgi:hypothetical protein